MYITNVRFESIIVPGTRFYKQPSCKGSSIKNGLKVQQLAKQLSTLKMLMQKNLFGLSKKFYSFNFKFAEAKFLHNCFWCNLIVYNSI